MHLQDAFLLYDSTCGSCSRFVRVIKKFDRKDKIEPVSLYSGLAFKLAGSRLTKEELHASFHLIVRDPLAGDQIFSEGSGLVHLLPYLPGGNLVFPIVRRFGPTRALASLFYDRIAKLRDRSGSCAN
ncbi:MAG: thiol-disulfide oxidoreductase DCC family protein [Nitrososphaerales archaeon]